MPRLGLICNLQSAIAVEEMMAKAGLLFVGTDDGAVLFSNPNNIGRWLRIGQPFRGQVVRALWPLPNNPLVVFAAVQGLGLQRSDDGGQSWQAALALDIDGVIGHYGAPGVLYAWAAGGELYASDDAGEHWDRRVSDERSAIGAAQLVIAAADARQLYLAQADGVWGSSDAGATWARCGEQVLDGVQALAAHPTHPGRLYAVAARALYRCDSPTGRWQPDTSAPLLDGLLAILAGQQPVLLAKANGEIMRGDETSASWTTAALDGGWAGAITVIAPVGYHIDTAFGGSAGGRLATSTDRGRTWQLLKQDLPPIRSVAAARLV
jgi:photosystem II stability/assembly factor-like uncharacterized protein